MPAVAIPAATGNVNGHVSSRHLRKGHDAWNAEMIAARWESLRAPVKTAAGKV